MRLDGWEGRLADYIEAHRYAAFAWGQHDCLTFASGAIEALTGQDKLKDDRRGYKSASGAVRALGRRDLAALISDRLKPISAKYPPRGSIIAIHSDQPPGIALGVVVSDMAAFVGPDGLTFLPACGQYAWEVD